MPNTNKPRPKAKKLVVVAALALLILAMPLWAQTANATAAGSGGSDVKQAVQKNIVEPVKKAIDVLTYVWAVAFWASVILLAIYAFIMLKAGPTTFSRWSGFVEMIDQYKRYLVGIIAVPFAIAALLTGVAATTGQSIDPWNTAQQFIKILFKPFQDVANAFLGGGG